MDCDPPRKDYFVICDGLHFDVGKRSAANFRRIPKGSNSQGTEIKWKGWFQKLVV